MMLGLALVAALGVGGCETMQGAGNKQLVGTGAGALLGGLAGSQIGSGSGRLWATGAGALVGALVGSDIGRSLDKADMNYAQQANYRAQSAPIGQSIDWNNPQSGNYGSVTPVNDGYDNGGRYCREFEQVIYVDGQQETGRGTACRMSDGKWEIIS